MPRQNESTDVLIWRLQSWEREAKTNKFGLAQVAENAIRALRAELAKRQPKKGSDDA